MILIYVPYQCALGFLGAQASTASAAAKLPILGPSCLLISQWISGALPRSDLLHHR
jgi:hypothetical protein